MELLLLFITLNILNVILQTVKAIATVKCGKLGASLINAVAFGLYTIVLVYMNCDLNLWVKALVVAICNLIGVYIVKFFEEKMRKNKLWKIEFAVSKEFAQMAFDDCQELAAKSNFEFSYFEVKNYYMFDTYCPTQKETIEVEKIVRKYNCKYFITETKDF